MYAYYTQSSGDFYFMHEDIGKTFEDSRGILRPHPDRKLLNLPTIQRHLHTIRNRPGFDDFYLNLASDLFNQPTGLLIYFKNGVDETVGAVYLEDCYINGHQLSISSGSVLIMEGASVQFDRLISVQMNVPKS
jgi:hypothetical protein